MPIFVLRPKSMPSTNSRKPCTKCWRDCSPSPITSMPASSCSLIQVSVASSLASPSASSATFHFGQSCCVSASQAGFGRLPAIAVSNMIEDSLYRLTIHSHAAGTVWLAPIARREREYTAVGPAADNWGDARITLPRVLRKNAAAVALVDVARPKQKRRSRHEDPANDLACHRHRQRAGRARTNLAGADYGLD